IQLRELGIRVDNLEGKLGKDDKSSVGMKRKNQILFLLSDKRMNADEIGKVLNLSRNRVNECLRALEKDGILTGDFEGKKKYYFINVKKDAPN
ncbi:MAG: winged helix-turn-helix domain-containing protein, partial [Candidatus Aenigmarchaeota archaeon]|nr:winged helix-turn-helix domain-containing protein [Candidatus Aenigmarchaeota archaeon]